MGILLRQRRSESVSKLLLIIPYKYTVRRNLTLGDILSRLTGSAVFMVPNDVFLVPNEVFIFPNIMFMFPNDVFMLPNDGNIISNTFVYCHCLFVHHCYYNIMFIYPNTNLSVHHLHCPLLPVKNSLHRSRGWISFRPHRYYNIGSKPEIGITI